MANSLHKGIVRAKQPSVANGPIETSVARDVSLNNVLHTADEAGQTAIALSTRSGTYLEHYDTTFANIPQLISAPAAWRMVALGTSAGSYYFRIRIGGATSTAGKGVKFRVSMGGLETGTDYVYETASTSSTTHAWLTGSSQGTEAWSNLIQVPRSALTLVSFDEGVTTGSQYQVAFKIWGIAEDSTGTPRLSGLYLCPYVGL